MFNIGKAVAVPSNATQQDVEYFLQSAGTSVVAVLLAQFLVEYPEYRDETLVVVDKRVSADTRQKYKIVKCYDSPYAVAVLVCFVPCTVYSKQHDLCGAAWSTALIDLVDKKSGEYFLELDDSISSTDLAPN